MSDMMFFNASDGYAEAFLRGLRKGFLTEANYNVIRNAQSLKDLKTVNIHFRIYLKKL